MSTASGATNPAAALYSETSRPAWFWWPAGLFVIGCIAIAYGSMLGNAWGLIVMVVGTLIVAIMVRLATWRTTVSASQLRVGSSVVTTDQIIGATALDPDEARLLAGQNADARAVFKLRGGSPAVRVDLDSVTCPYWLISTRNPEALSTAVMGLVEQRAAQ